MIAVLIIERPLCVNCISGTSGLTADEVKSYLGRVRRVVSVEHGIDRCRACDAFTAVYSMLRAE
jgi:hypothetical protein